VAVVLWGANPSFVGATGQPVRGLVLILVTVIASVVLSPLVLYTIGQGVSPPGPIPSHFAIIVVPTTFWLCIMMGGWPFAGAVRNPVASGLAVLVAAYVVTAAVFFVFFNYDFLKGSPVYLSFAPAGLFNGVTALVFYVTALAVMFLVLCFDLWPFTTVPSLMKQPVLGLVWTLVTLGGAAVAIWLGVISPGADPMLFLTGVTVPFIFGSIIVLNMLQNSLFAKWAQPLKGVLNAVAAAAIGLLLAHLYAGLGPRVTGALPSGPPGYEREIWLANALLSVTFPFLVYHAAFFGFWPLTARASKSS